MVLTKQDNRGSRQSFKVIDALSKGVQKDIGPDRIVAAIEVRIVWITDDEVSVLEDPAQLPASSPH